LIGQVARRMRYFTHANDVTSVYKLSDKQFL